MPRFYTVDRVGVLVAGSVVCNTPRSYSYAHPVNSNLETSHEVEVLLNSYFPGEISVHGRQYGFQPYPLLQGGMPFSHAIEMVAELVRRLIAPDVPSRMQSMFACETLADAQAFKAKMGVPHARIFEVDANDFFRADMQLLNLGAAFGSTINLMQKYWQGVASANPFWELLLPGKVTILSQVDP